MLFINTYTASKFQGASQALVDAQKLECHNWSSDKNSVYRIISTFSRTVLHLSIFSSWWQEYSLELEEYVTYGSDMPALEDSVNTDHCTMNGSVWLFHYIFKFQYRFERGFH